RGRPGLVYSALSSPPRCRDIRQSAMLAPSSCVCANGSPGWLPVRRFGSVAVLLLLAACSMPPEGAVRPKHAAPPPAKQPETASLPQPPAPARADPPPAEKIDPKRLVGLSRDQVAALIGPPASISDTPPATT